MSLLAKEFRVINLHTNDSAFAAEHNVLYQYSLHNANDHYMGLIQTETVCVRYVFQD